MDTRRLPRWAGILFSTDPVSARATEIAVGCLRIVAGLIWLYNVVWKVPPDFGRNGNTALYHFTRQAVEHPVLPPFSWLVEHVVLRWFTAFGWLTLMVETALAVLLLTGTAVRFAAVLGIGQSLAIALSVAEAPGEWPWSYIMLIAIHTVLLFTPAGRFAAVDAVRADRGAARLLRRLGVALVVVAVVALLGGLHNPVRAPLGAFVGYEPLQFSLGNYNLIGALALLVTGAAMLVAALSGGRPPALVALVLAAAAAATLYVQSGRTASWLGGTNTSAAVFVCAVVVVAATWRRPAGPKKGS
ncbi:hypothetical protein AB0L63_16055 [Nocardia sp. NPDC051990]|uniref:Rv1678 family membrane protein n=1 Tax=Nocardia sp. NPDC051990 TaxID=3155285 RepID=UPI00342429C8